MRDLSWALDARLFGFANPLGYHLGNVVLNAVNVVLAFLFLLRATRRFELALVVAGAFAVIPVHIEPVCWVIRTSYACSRRTRFEKSQER